MSRWFSLSLDFLHFSTLFLNAIRSHCIIRYGEDMVSLKEAVCNYFNLKVFKKLTLIINRNMSKYRF